RNGRPRRSVRCSSNASKKPSRCLALRWLIFAIEWAISSIAPSFISDLGTGSPKEISRTFDKSSLVQCGRCEGIFGGTGRSAAIVAFESILNVNRTFGSNIFGNDSGTLGPDGTISGCADGGPGFGTCGAPPSVDSRGSADLSPSILPPRL